MYIFDVLVLLLFKFDHKVIINIQDFVFICVGLILYLGRLVTKMPTLLLFDSVSLFFICQEKHDSFSIDCKTKKCKLLHCKHVYCIVEDVCQY